MWLPALCMVFLVLMHGSDAEDVSTDILNNDNSDKSLLKGKLISAVETEDEDQLKIIEEQQLNIDPKYDENVRLYDSRELAIQLPAEQIRVISGRKPRKGKKPNKRRRKKNKNRYRYIIDGPESNKQVLWKTKNGVSFRKADETIHGTFDAKISSKKRKDKNGETTEANGGPKRKQVVDEVKKYLFGVGETDSIDDIYIGVLKPIKKFIDRKGAQSGATTGGTGATTGGTGATTGGTGATTGGTGATTGGTGATTGLTGATTGGTGATTKGMGETTKGAEETTMGAEETTMGVEETTMGSEEPTMGKISMVTGETIIGTIETTFGTGEATMGTGKTTMGKGETTMGTGETTKGAKETTKFAGETTIVKGKDWEWNKNRWFTVGWGKRK